MLGQQLNVAKEISITLRAIKPARHALGSDQNLSLLVKARP